MEDIWEDVFHGDLKTDFKTSVATSKCVFTTVNIIIEVNNFFILINYENYTMCLLFCVRVFFVSLLSYSYNWLAVWF